MDRLKASGNFFEVVSSRLQVIGSCLQVTGSRLQVTGSHLQVIGSRLKVTGSHLQVTGSRLQVIGSYLQVTGSRLQEICCCSETKTTSSPPAMPSLCSCLMGLKYQCLLLFSEFCAARFTCFAGARWEGKQQLSWRCNANSPTIHQNTFVQNQLIQKQMEELFRKLMPLIRTKMDWTKEQAAQKCDYKDGSHLGKFENEKADANYIMIGKMLKKGGLEITAMEGKFSDGETVRMELNSEGVWFRKKE
jgi:hypothetical protein